jgi:hypothetical protein
MAYQQELNFDRFLDGMTATLSLVVDDIVKNGYELLKTIGSHPNKAQDVFCVFSSPWYISQTKNIVLHEEKPILVSEKFIEDLIKRSVEQFKNSETAKQSLQIENNAELIEQRIIEIKLNGYETSSPHGKQANKIELALYTSMISKEVKLRVSKVVTESFHEKVIEFHSFALSMFSYIRDTHPGIHDYLIFDFGGEVTDVSLVRSGVLMQTVSVPFGGNVIIRKIVEKLNTNPEEALSQVSLFVKDQLHEDKLSKLREALDLVEKEWLALVGNLLKGLSAEVPLPNTIFHTTSDDLSQIFVTFIKKETFNQSALVSEKFNLVALQSDDVSVFCTFAPQVSRDLFLGLEAAFFEKVKTTSSIKTLSTFT